LAELGDYRWSIIITRDCLRAILAEAEKPGGDREETLEKIKVAANAGLEHLNKMLDASG
jgi:hypothetical protein